MHALFQVSSHSFRSTASTIEKLRVQELPFSAGVSGKNYQTISRFSLTSAIRKLVRFTLLWNDGFDP